MTRDDWLRVIDDAAALGVGHVQFIGGEPTLHPELPAMVRHALRDGLSVGIYTNLVKVRREIWELLESGRVELHTSYYSADAARHDAITGRRSHHLTLRNVEEARRRGVPVHVGVIDLH